MPFPRALTHLASLVAFAGCAAPRPAPPAALAAEAAPPGARLQTCGLVLAPGAAGAWDDGMIESPAVWYDAARRRYGMAYVGYGRRPGARRGYTSVTAPSIGLAWSDDLRTWTKDPAGPILGPGGPSASDAAGATGPFVWVERGVYHLFYIGVTERGYEGGRKALHLATSTDLRTWTRDPANPLIVPAGDGWRRDAIWRPYVVRRGERYYLFFNASGVVGGVEEERIGYATSTDLRRWTVDDANAPVLSGSGVPGTWDAAGRAGDPSVYRVGDRWVMAYYSWNKRHAQDGLATTTDAAFPLGWRPYAGNPVLRIGPPGAVDALHAHKPTVFRERGRHYHFYTAVDTAQTRAIALAVEGAPCR